MKKRRLILALTVALAVSGSLTLWLSKRMNKVAIAQSTELHYVATARKVDAGEVLKSEDLVSIGWPASNALEGAFTNAQDVVGHAVLYPLAQGEPIQDGQLAAAGSGVGLSAEIPAGMRALSLRSDEIVGVAGFLLPQMRVDVLVTYTDATSPNPVTSIVLQNVEVLAVGQRMEADPRGRPTPVGVVTLLVSPEDAEKAVLASAQGKVHFTLRNGMDTKQMDVRPVEMTELGQREDARTAPRKQAVQTPAPAQPTKYSVEVVAGDKATMETVP